MKNILIIGLGEIGSAIKRLEEEAGNSVSVIELDYCDAREDNKYDVTHICIPYVDGEQFSASVLDSLDGVDSGLLIIHSTVEIGTTDYLSVMYGQDFVHSFCRGVHPNLYEGLKTFEKPVGCLSEDIALDAAKHLNSVGVPVRMLSDSGSSELGKLLSTTYYGYCILFAGAVFDMCQEHGLDYEEVYTWANQSYNEGYKKLGKDNVVRPVLYPPDGEIGGHCVVPNFLLLPESELKDFCIKHSSPKAEA